MPPGIVVQVGTSYFQHVHSSEYNVYDFTQWASGLLRRPKLQFYTFRRR